MSECVSKCEDEWACDEVILSKSGYVAVHCGCSCGGVGRSGGR